MQQLRNKLRCAIAGHVKLVPPGQDPDGYKLVFIDIFDEKKRLSINKCLRCGAHYMTTRYIPGMAKPPVQVPPLGMAPWPVGQNATRTDS